MSPHATTKKTSKIASAIRLMQKDRLLNKMAPIINSKTYIIVSKYFGR